MTTACRRALREARLLDRGRARGERQVGLDADVVRRDPHAQRAHRLDDLDRDRPDARLAALDAARAATRAPTYCTPPRTTLNAASITRRFGYTPSAAAKNSSPSRV